MNQHTKLTKRAITAVLAGLLAAMLLLPTGPAMAATNDPFFPRLWGLQRVGAEPAWGASRGGGVMIAVIDSGVDLNHPDLRSKLVPGRDFIANDSSPMDENGHGTLVAGVAGAATNNGVGIASVAPDVSIMPVRVFDANGQADPEMAAEAIQWSVDEAGRRGMKLVLNLSFVGDPDSGLLTQIFTPSVDREIREAAQRGAAVVAAAGNEGRSTTAYDTTTPGVLVVGATDTNDRRWSQSNYGAGLDLVAPGLDITSTYWNQGQSGYGTAAGTSMSVPFVAGTFALLMSKGMSNSAAMTRILETAQDLGAPGRDNEYGAGLLDVAGALGVSRGGAPPPAENPPSTPPKQKQSPTPQTPASPNPPPPLVLPSPGEPPAITQEPAEPPKGATATTANDVPGSGADKSQPGGWSTMGASLLVLLVGTGHVLRRTGSL
ncbi:MAG TPA: S8 family serine peptidase [Actinomycetota bacterium]|nr:S8 family serine peptidase [Actinomycetota bacterium]